jgi:hypothetical protein
MITLSLTIAQTQQIFNALAERPFKEVNELLALILKQANEQSAPPPPSEPAAS